MQLSRNMLAACSLLLIGVAGSDAARAQPSALAAVSDASSHPSVDLHPLSGIPATR